MMLKTFLLICLAMVCLSIAHPARADTLPSQGPSFNCKIAAGRVEQIICHNPRLSAADRDLAAIFNNTRYQGGIDGKALQHEEDVWLARRNQCATTQCIAAAYATRKAQILDESLRAASPATYDETRPYQAPPPALAMAADKIGGDCAEVGFGGAASPFVAIPGFLPVITAQGIIWPVAAGAARFAFLLNNAGPACKIADVVTLPPPVVADIFMECFPDDANSMGLAPVGFGMRESGVSGNIAYWDVDSKTGKLAREPLGVLGLDKSGLKCQQPESGD